MWARFVKGLFAGDCIGWSKFMRVAGVGMGSIHVIWAFQAELDNDRFGLALFCLVAAMYFYLVGKAHSRLKHHNEKNKDR